MQSLDVCLQTQKLKRPVMLVLVKSIIKLCKELSEYALNMSNVLFQPKYMMLSSGEEEIQFVYAFQPVEEESGLEQLLEFCIEHLDYQDEQLIEGLYRVYERLLEQRQNFLLSGEMEKLLEVLGEPENSSAEVGRTSSESDRAMVEAGKAVSAYSAREFMEGLKPEDPFNADAETVVISPTTESGVARREFRNLKYGLFGLLLLDLTVFIFWKPITLLKIFFGIAVGAVLVVLDMQVHRREKIRQRLAAKQQQARYVEEYETISQSGVSEDNGTQIISIESSEGVLYNLQKGEPQYIYIGDTGKIIGKDPNKAQILLQQAGVSRIHAMVVKEGTECVIEDLNSTNGTWINEKLLEPRARYVLKQGDKVRFAGLEYIFR